MPRGEDEGEDALESWRHAFPVRPVALCPSQREALDHRARQVIYDLLRKRRGLRLSEINRTTRSGWGSMHHHLKILESQDLIVSHKFGHDRIYFPRGFPQEKARLWAILNRPRPRQFLETVLDRPGLHQRELLDRIGMSRKVLREQVAILQDAGLLEERKDRSRCTYHPTQQLRRLLVLGP